MASFHAELHLAGNRYRAVRCHYACHQATDGRGRVVAKVRHNLLHLTLDVPDSDVLLNWAATPHKPLAGQVVFYSATQLVALETIAFTAGECVGYHEQFESGASGDGAYVCQLTITAPAFELRAGGAPAAVAAAVAAAVTKARRKSEGSETAGSSAAPPPTGETSVLPATATAAFAAQRRPRLEEEDAPAPLTTKMQMKAVKKALLALQSRLEACQTELTQWDAPAKARFASAFGTTDAEDRDVILARTQRMSVVVENYLAAATYKACFHPIDDEPTNEDGEIIALVHPNAPPDVYLCPPFWRLSSTGPDSQLVTLAHELTHFNNVGPTEDHKYGLEECEALTSRPALALQNADTFAYYTAGIDFTPPTL